MFRACLVAVLFLTQLNQSELPDQWRLTPDSLKLPSGDGGWTVRVTQAGGIAGRVLHDITVNSEGIVTCAGSAPCPKTLRDDDLRSLMPLIMPVTILKLESSRSDLCRDCILTRITVRRRETGGADRTYFAFWDDVTATKAAPELMRIVQAVIVLPK